MSDDEDPQFTTIDGVEGVTIHIEPHEGVDGRFIIRVAVNGRIVKHWTWYGVANASIPATVADVLTKAAKRYAEERPDWAKRAVIGAFRTIFQQYQKRGTTEDECKA